jgi:hypothetical protein
MNIMEGFMLKSNIKIIILLALFFGCSAPYELLVTNKQQPLPLNAEVKVLAWGTPGDYEQVAIVDVGEYGLEKRVEHAKEAARHAGGNIIMPKIHLDPKSSDDPGAYLVQTFIILKAKPPEEKKVAVVKNPADDSKKSDSEYSKLPTLKYNDLIDDIDSIKGERYQWSLYPIGAFKVPKPLRSVARGKIIYKMGGETGKQVVLLVIPKKEGKRLKKMGRNSEQLAFVYTPVMVYKKKFPVIEYVDDLEPAKDRDLE